MIQASGFVTDPYRIAGPRVPGSVAVRPPGRREIGVGSSMKCRALKVDVLRISGGNTAKWRPLVRGRTVPGGDSRSQGNGHRERRPHQQRKLCVKPLP